VYSVASSQLTVLSCAVPALAVIPAMNCWVNVSNSPVIVTTDGRTLVALHSMTRHLPITADCALPLPIPIVVLSGSTAETTACLVL
jgi:hypothetical protein